MSTIYKYKLGKIGETQNVFIDMPAGAEPLSVFPQRGGPHEALFLWARVNQAAQLTRRHFRAFMTGEPMDLSEGDKYIGTAHMADGLFVLHVYEIVGRT